MLSSRHDATVDLMDRIAGCASSFERVVASDPGQEHADATVTDLMDRIGG
jgi:hypothetical protein